MRMSGRAHEGQEEPYMDDSMIVDLYWNRDDSAIGATADKYGAKLSHLAENMLRVREDAEECVNDTYLRTWNSIPSNRPEHLFGYIAKICRNLALNHIERLNAKKRSADVMELSAELEMCIPDQYDQQREDSERIAAALTGFLRELPEDQRLIFMRRYWFSDSVKAVAERYGISESKVKTTLFRVRAKLREHLEKEDIVL